MDKKYRVHFTEITEPLIIHASDAMEAAIKAIKITGITSDLVQVFNENGTLLIQRKVEYIVDTEVD